MQQLWIQYSYEDTTEAAVCQCADTMKQAKRDDKDFPGCPWYAYDIEPDTESDGKLTNKSGPYYF